MSAQISKKTRIPNRAARTFVKNGYSRTGSTYVVPKSIGKTKFQGIKPIFCRCLVAFHIFGPVPDCPPCKRKICIHVRATRLAPDLTILNQSGDATRDPRDFVDYRAAPVLFLSLVLSGPHSAPLFVLQQRKLRFWPVRRLISRASAAIRGAALRPGLRPS